MNDLPNTLPPAADTPVVDRGETGCTPHEANPLDLFRYLNRRKSVVERRDEEHDYADE